MAKMNNSLYLQACTYWNIREPSHPITDEGLKEIDKGFPKSKGKFKTLYMS